MHQQKLRNNRLSNLFVAYCFFQMTLANFPSLILIKTAKLYHIRVIPTNTLLHFDFEYNKISKQTVWAWSVYFFDLIHDFCDDDQKIQRFLTFLTDNDVRHIFYLYKGKKWFIGHVFHSLNTWCKVSRFKEPILNFQLI